MVSILSRVSLLRCQQFYFGVHISGKHCPGHLCIPRLHNNNLRWKIGLKL
uniref:Uncharacterized protein n=1 Tax=Arion vulgaris TaxID=1028688 RepID=A0A0B7ADI1_9EUPU